MKKRYNKILYKTTRVSTTIIFDSFVSLAFNTPPQKLLYVKVSKSNEFG